MPDRRELSADPLVPGLARAHQGFVLRISQPGEKNAQVDPKFAGPIPKKFPDADEDIRAGKVTVSQILSRYRDAYSPAEGSPLVGAGDPADGDGSFIGAVGGGKKAPNDHFGRLAKDKK